MNLYLGLGSDFGDCTKRQIVQFARELKKFKEFLYISFCHGNIKNLFSKGDLL